MKIALKTALDVLRFIIYVPLAFVFLHFINIGIVYITTLFMDWPLWALLIGWFFIFGLIIGTIYGTVGLVAALLSYINPYKKLGKWIIIPIAIWDGVKKIIFIWSFFDVENTKEIILALFVSTMILVISFAFCLFISNKNPKEFLT